MLKEENVSSLVLMEPDKQPSMESKSVLAAEQTPDVIHAMEIIHHNASIVKMEPIFIITNATVPVHRKPGKQLITLVKLVKQIVSIARIILIVKDVTRFIISKITNVSRTALTAQFPSTEYALFVLTQDAKNAYKIT
jgi:hypothetical protein